MSDKGSSGAFRVVLALGALVVWGALLVHAFAPAPGPGAVSVWQLRHAGSALALCARLLVAAGAVALRCAPFGIAAAFVPPDHDSRWLRPWAIGLPAWLLGTFVAWAAFAIRAAHGGAAAPGPSDLVAPALGVLLGVVCGMAARRGVFAVLWLPVRLAAWCAALAMLTLVLVLLALQRQPLVPSPAPVDSAEKRHLVALLRYKNPDQVEPGETRTLRLAQDDVDGLTAWLEPLVANPARMRGGVVLAGDTLALRSSARVPLLGRWFNVEASARARVDAGRLRLASPRLRVGRFAAPAALLDAGAPVLASAIAAERPVRPLLAATHALAVEQGALSVTYGHFALAGSPIARVVWGDAAGSALREAVARDVRGIVDAAATAPAGDERFSRAYTTAFALARARTVDGTPALDANRAAVLALGFVLGSERLSTFLGGVADSDVVHRAVALRATATVHGRRDWTRHFSLSAAITALSAVAPSNAVGLLKEELDADPSGGSGFSFSDLLADRSGTTFAEHALADAAGARALQQRVAAGFRMNEFVPPGADMPENISDAELRTRYGGTGGAKFRATTAEIERRIGALAGYR